MQEWCTHSFPIVKMEVQQHENTANWNNAGELDAC